jgi:hypothetical protein
MEGMEANAPWFLAALPAVDSATIDPTPTGTPPAVVPA